MRPACVQQMSASVAARHSASVSAFGRSFMPRSFIA
jgi:hypothetical protein